MERDRGSIRLRGTSYACGLSNSRQPVDLDARAAKALDAVGSRNQQQQSGRIDVADHGEVHRQLFARGASRGRMHMMHQVRAAHPGRDHEFIPRLDIALRKMRNRIHREIGIAASASAAR